MKKLLFPLILFATLLAVGCKKENNEPEIEPSPTTAEYTLTLSSKDVTIVKGLTYKLEAKVTGLAEDEYTLVWSSDDEAIAEVDNTGLITANKNGEATISCTLTYTALGERLTRRCNVTVSADRVILSDDTIYMTPNSKDKISATILSGKSLPITYKTANSTVVTVDKDGNITSLSKKGNTYIIASAMGVEPDTCLVYVGDFLTIEPRNARVKKGESIDLVPSEDKVTWTVADPNIVRMEGNKAYGVNLGSTTVTATFGTMKATAKIEVYTEPQSLKFNIPQEILIVGQEGSFSFLVRDEAVTVTPEEAQSSVQMKLILDSKQEIELAREDFGWRLQASMENARFHKKCQLVWYFKNENGKVTEWTRDVVFFPESMYKTTEYTSKGKVLYGTACQKWSDKISMPELYTIYQNNKLVYYENEIVDGINGKGANITYDTSDQKLTAKYLNVNGPGIGNAKSSTYCVQIYADAFDGKQVKKRLVGGWNYVFNSSFIKYTARAKFYYNSWYNGFLSDSNTETTDPKCTSLDVRINSNALDYPYVSKQSLFHGEEMYYLDVRRYYYKDINQTVDSVLAQLSATHDEFYDKFYFTKPTVTFADHTFTLNTRISEYN